MPGRTNWTTVLVVVLVGLVAVMLYGRLHLSDRNPLSSPAGRSDYSGEALTKEAIIQATNQARADNGFPALMENALLDQIAADRARDMLEKQYFAHVSPTGEQASDLAMRVGYHYKIIAENIGAALFLTNRKVVDSWMQSPGHRKNIVSPDVKEIGVAITKGRLLGNELYVAVQIFGLQSLPEASKNCAAPSEQLQKEIENKKAELSALNASEGRTRSEIESEREAIDSERRYARSQQEINDLNVRIKVCNEKSEWHNRIVADMKAKAAVLQSMIDEYNRALENYTACMRSE